MLKKYAEQVSRITGQGDAREESYYSVLERLIKEYAESNKKKNIHITTLPKKTEAGNPDFRIWDGKQHIVGYIEAKPPTVEDLGRVEDSEQLKRYRHTFPNLILTNFFEFRLYRNGNLAEKVLIGRPFIAHKLKTTPPVEKETDFINLLEKFFAFSLPRVYDAKTLAMELAKRTRFLKDEVISEELKEENKKSFILGFYEAFSRFLIGGLSKEDFADLYSQTVTYGLFAARTRSENGFNRKLAYDKIPQTIGILRDVFRFISLEDLPRQMEWIIDDISEVLAVTDVKNILHKYFHEGKGKDPIVHFYETFLAEYDPKTRERRGVYYTPEPVVSYIVRALHIILKENFNRENGLASDSVTVLDPAAGTLTFLAEASKLAAGEFVSRYGEGGKGNFIKDHVLKNFFAFELMMAPYAVGHIKMSFLLEEFGYNLHQDERFKLYLTNSLEMEELAQTELPGMASLSEESHLAGKVKKEQPILVILGNPPYSGHSANVSEKYVFEVKNGKQRKRKVKTWIGNLIESYKFVDGKPLGEKNPKWLQDDYVKFIRFAQWKIDQAGEGVLGFITNHSYLDNPTFRGMRQSLMNSFNEIYILDLHGSSLKREKCPDGSKDVNVFDIRQGVAIAIFIKRKGEKRCTVRHQQLWGLRNKKYKWLLDNNLKTTKWKRLSPKKEFYFFIPRDEKLLKGYEKHLKITDIFPTNSVGIVTARDKLTIKWTPEEIWNTVRNFSNMDIELARDAYNLGKDSKDWKVNWAQADLKNSGLEKKKIVPILYRPFDTRHTYYTGKSGGFHCRPRPEVMRHMMKDNLALSTTRSIDIASGWGHLFCTNKISESHIVSLKESNYLFPLYLYEEITKRKNPFSAKTLMLFEPQAAYAAKRPNINQKLLQALKNAYKKEPSPEDVFYYIYGTLYSNIYREKYTEFLKTDFPRVPFTKDKVIFKKMGRYGEKLVELHLLKSKALARPIAKFHGKGNKKVEKPTYKDGDVQINATQYFGKLPEDIWNYQIGGYRICEKWLKDRKGKTLGLEEIKQYCKIATALEKTIDIQKKIDEIYSDLEKETIPFQ